MRSLLPALLLTLAATLPAADFTGFTLVDAASDSDIAALTEGDVLDLAGLPTSLSVRADVSGTPSGTVDFVLSGAESHSQSEGIAPYALFGDSGGDYDPWTPSLGNYALAVTVDGVTTTIGFSVTDSGSGGGGGSTGEDGDGSVTIGGEAKRWHRVDLAFAAIHSSQTSSPNPFRDYRFNVAFTAPGGTVLDVPGYFAGDGAGGSSGNVWMAHLNPHDTGTWTYRVSFRQGADAAVALSDTVGSAVAPYDGITGSFTVGPSDKSGDDFRAPGKGLLVNRGDHYLTYAGSGKPFLYTGPGIPENILGYRGFTNTSVGVGHEFAVHGQHWNVGDPNWATSASGLDGKNLIGAINYIADQGANGLYMMSNTLGGDGKDCFPTIDTTSKDRYDLRKLQQWDIALAHAQAKGIFLNWHLAEHESANQFWFGSATSVERKLYFRMLIARFGHYNGLKWNIMEETEWNASERDAQMDYIHAVDPYDHPVTYQVGGAGIPYQTYDDHLGDPDIDAGSFQGGASRDSMFNTVQNWRTKSAAAGEPWTIAWDEPQKIENDNDDQTAGYPHGRRDKMWPCLMAGGDGFMWYIQKDGGGHGFDQRIEDFTIMQNAFNWSGHIRDFLEPLPLMQMQSSMGIVDSSTGRDYALYQSGEVYAIYNDRAGQGMRLDLSGVSGTFEVRWFDPRSGGGLQTGSVASVTGGGVRDLGSAPSNSGDDWAVLVRRSGGEPSNQGPQAKASADTTSGDAPLTVAFSSAGSSDSDGSIVGYAWDFGDGSSSTAANPGHTYDQVGTYTATLTVTDDDGASHSDSVVIEVTSAPVDQGPFGGSAHPIAASGASRIQAEDYDLGGEGVAYHDTDSGNRGGAYRSDAVDLQSTSDTGGGVNVGWIAAGEWLEYTVDVAAAGTYQVELRVARKPSGNVDCHLEVAGSDLSGPIAVPSTGGWQHWTTVDAQVELAEGEQVLRLAMDGSSFNVNWIAFSPAGTANQPPVASVSASPTTGQAPLAVAFSSDGSGDSDGAIASYAWDFGDGNGSTAANPSHTYQVAGSYTATLTVTDDDGASASASVAIEVTATTGGTVLIDEDFASGTGGFGYQDDVFRGTAQPAYAAGQRSGDALTVTLGGVDGADILGMSGGWSRGFTLTDTSDLSLNLAWKVEMPTNFESDEYVEVLVAIDGQLHGANGTDHLVRIAGGGSTAWATFTLDLADVPAGDHVLTIGAYANKKTAATEHATASFDDVRLVADGSTVQPGEVVAAINAGGAAYTAGDGTAYDADPATAGRTYRNGNAIAGTDDDVLYQSERYGAFGYDLALPDGDYLLTLQFAEIYWNADGKRRFDVVVEGAVVVDDLDIHAQVGKNAVYDVVLPVTLADGVLDVDFVTLVDNAKLSALLVERSAAVSQ